MKLKSLPDLHVFLSTYFPDAEVEADEETTRAYMKIAPTDRRQQIIIQAKSLLASTETFPLEELGTEANRWFSDHEEARAWLRLLLSTFEEAQQPTFEALIVKDSNGAPLEEGDSVQVIKDLKVKGGSSDLKRGTHIKKIHLIGNPEAIECRVDGSTLVLKTCFLKKV